MNHGFVVVDVQQRTSNPRARAAGDVTVAPQYVYVAAAAGRAAALNALCGATAVDYTGLPAVTFTRPQVASAGRAALFRHRHMRDTVDADPLPSRCCGTTGNQP